MEEVKDKCSFCGKEIIIKDKNVIASLKTCKGKDKCTKIYCSNECKQKNRQSVEGCLDVNQLFS